MRRQNDLSTTQQFNYLDFIRQWRQKEEERRAGSNSFIRSSLSLRTIFPNPDLLGEAHQDMVNDIHYISIYGFTVELLENMRQKYREALRQDPEFADISTQGGNCQQNAFTTLFYLAKEDTRLDVEYYFSMLWFLKDFFLVKSEDSCFAYSKAVFKKHLEQGEVNEFSALLKEYGNPPKKNGEIVNINSPLLISMAQRVCRICTVKSHELINQKILKSYFAPVKPGVLLKYELLHEVSLKRVKEYYEENNCSLSIYVRFCDIQLKTLRGNTAELSAEYTINPIEEKDGSWVVIADIYMAFLSKVESSALIEKIKDWGALFKWLIKWGAVVDKKAKIEAAAQKAVDCLKVKWKHEKKDKAVKEEILGKWKNSFQWIINWGSAAETEEGAPKVENLKNLSQWLIKKGVAADEEMQVFLQANIQEVAEYLAAKNVEGFLTCKYGKQSLEDLRKEGRGGAAPFHVYPTTKELFQKRHEEMKLKNSELIDVIPSRKRGTIWERQIERDIEGI